MTAPRCASSCTGRAGAPAPPERRTARPGRGVAPGHPSQSYAAGVDDDPIPTLPKPDALLALHEVTAELFGTLRRWFAVPGEVVLDLHGIDSAVRELGDPLMIAALAMRKLQALRLLSTPGVMTTTDVIVTIIQDLDRALVQAPNMYLKLQAAAADWDAELAVLDGDAGDVVLPAASAFDWPDAPSDDRADVPGDADVADPDDEFADGPADVAPGGAAGPPFDRLRGEAPVDPTQADPESDRFRELHGRLHEAVFEVLEASEGEIRYFV
jgi:hypothetical protein